MSPQIQSAQRFDPPSAPTPCQQKALHLLREAWIAAQAAGCDRWQFAVEIGQLRAAGLSHTDLRRLLCGGYLEHACECTNGGARQRTFRYLNTLALPRRTCFVLTAKGMGVVSEYHATNGASVAALAREQRGRMGCSLADVPCWDSACRELWWRDHLIKQFHRSAVNQELILAALEEEGWPARIDDPLPQMPGIDPKVRLHDTIKSLNRHRLQRIISFRGDGSGTGVGWIMVGNR